MKKFIIEKTLDSYQTDRNGFIRPLVLMNELQGLADNHAESLGFGRSFCLNNNLAWVVTHYLIDIIKLPREGDKIKLTTWPSGHGGVKATRDFEIFDSNDELIIRATSQWVLIDLEKRSLIRLSENLQNFECLDQRALNRTFEHFPEFETEKSHVFKCRYDDVDVNQHINNAVYVIWATESVGFEFRNNHKLVGLDINFKKEISPNTPEVSTDVLIDGLVSHHKIKTGDIVNADIVCRWQEIKN